MRNLIFIFILHFSFFILHFSFFILHFSFFTLHSAQAQDKTFEQIQQELQKEFDSFAAGNEAEFEQYRKEIDEEFAEYLRQAWKEFSLYAAISPDTTPKPVTLPGFDPMIPVGTPRQIQLEPDQKKPEPLIPVPNTPVILPPPEEDETPGLSLEIDFYGHSIGLTYDPGMVFTLPSRFSHLDIADFWEDISNSGYSMMVAGLLDEKAKMNLNDWGYYLLVNQVCSKISSSTNTAHLMAWYFLTKSGYKVRIAYTETSIYLLFPAQNLIYGMKYFLVDNVKYYAPDFPSGQVMTYETDFPDATRIMDMNLYNALNIGSDFKERIINITYNGLGYRVPVKYNLNSIGFFKDYPLCELAVYFDAAISPEAKESLLLSLLPQVEGKPEVEAVNFLLDFVQNGFAYKTDPEQFHGMEKFFFPEENFYYPFSDCDDRAVLFAWIVREALHLKVVGVEYPGHVATAIHFNSDVPGDFLILNGEKYVIADPTYINAPVGLTMPGMINSKARIIDLLNEQNIASSQADIWKNAEACGGKQGDNFQTVVSDHAGNFYLTGYFSGDAVFGNTTLSSLNGSNDVFIASFTSSGMPRWAAQAEGERNDLAYNIAMDDEENLYITGSFHGTIRFGNEVLRAPVYTDQFIAKYDPSGRLLWVNQAELDTTAETSDYIFVSSFTPEGRHIGTRLFPEDESFTDFGIRFDPEGNIHYTANYSGTVGLNIDLIWLDTGAEFNLINTLKDETDKQLANQCEQTIAGLFAAISLVRINSVMISGKTVQETFNRYNPGFKALAPKVYECIGKVNVMKNNEGIVTVLTEDEDPVTLDKIKITNDARLKVTLLPSGDAKIEILGGVKVGKAFIWFPLNYVRLFRTNGNVLFDYDTDHSQVTLNMKKDMLF